MAKWAGQVKLFSDEIEESQVGSSCNRGVAHSEGPKLIVIDANS